MISSENNIRSGQSNQTSLSSAYRKWFFMIENWAFCIFNWTLKILRSCLVKSIACYRHWYLLTVRAVALLSVVCNRATSFDANPTITHLDRNSIKAQSVISSVNVFFCVTSFTFVYCKQTYCIYYYVCTCII